MRPSPGLIRRWLAAGIALAAGLGVQTGTAVAHGINAHIWVSDRAVDLVFDCELHALLADPDIRPVVQISPAFPDSGYAADHPYGEAAHWEPWTEAYLRHLRQRFGNDFTSDAARRHIAFWMGASSHGLEDEIFDSLFIYKSEEVDGAGQDLIDTLTDFLLIAQGHAALQPEVWLPPDLPSIFADPEVGVPVHMGQIEGGMFTVHEIVIGLVDNPVELDQGFGDLIPWAAEHYFDPQAGGSIGYEPPIVARYYEALWKRLHNRFVPERDLLLGGVPEYGGRLRANRPDTVDAWISLWTGIGVRTGSLDGKIALIGPDGVTVPIRVRPTRWGNAPDDWGRVIQIRPEAELLPDSSYRVELRAGLELIDGRALEQTLEWPLRSACASVDLRNDCDGAFAPTPETSCPTPVPAAATPEPETGCGSGGRAALAPLLPLLTTWLWLRRRQTLIPDSERLPRA